VRKGETLVTIADRFGVSLSQLRRWNAITGIKVEPGRRLHVADPSTSSHTASRTHRRGSSQAGAKTPEAAPAAKRTHTHTSGTASGAKKSGTTSQRKSTASRHAAPAKSSSSKQKK
jgi:membrane-bound lytic murein transglycosylase D